MKKMALRSRLRVALAGWYVQKSPWWYDTALSDPETLPFPFPERPPVEAVDETTVRRPKA